MATCRWPNRREINEGEGCQAWIRPTRGFNGERRWWGRWRWLWFSELEIQPSLAARRNEGERGEMRKKMLEWENTNESSSSISIYLLNFLSNDAYVPFKWQFDSTKWLILGPWIGSGQEQKFLEINQRTQNHNFSRLREKTQLLWNWWLSLLKSEVVERGVSGHRMATGQIQKFLGIIWTIYWT